MLFTFPKPTMILIMIREAKLCFAATGVSNVPKPDTKPPNPTVHFALILPATYPAIRLEHT